MRTAEEMLKEAKNNDNGFGNNEILSLMKEYAIEVAKEALKNASENALLVNKFGNDIGSFAFDENSNKIWINKQSILNESNIPKL